MKEALDRKYADVILKSGINLREDQPVLIRTEVAQRGFAGVLARRAYELGASYVYVTMNDPKIDRARVEAARDSSLDFVPSFFPPTYRAYVDENWASIGLVGAEDPDVLEGVDSARLGRIRKAGSIAAQEWLQRVSSNEIAWNVCLYPTPGWAAKVLGDSADWESRIWKDLIPILRLDADDPAAAWEAHDKELKRRANHVNAARYDQIRFSGPGTDLSIGMRPNRRFLGGRGQAKDGRDFFANIPTEEIFSTPDAGRAEGTVRCTRPVEVMGTNVEGAWFRFENGAAVEFGAEKNAKVLEQFLKLDDRARYLGEVALVGTDSPIYRSGRIFHSILFDENAACHIALGNGYTECVEGATGKSREDLMADGCNVSLVHVDFMIGSDAVSVFGVHADGREERIIENGRFVI
jgi:aminopeptidase